MIEKDTQTTIRYVQGVIENVCVRAWVLDRLDGYEESGWQGNQQKTDKNLISHINISV